MRRSAWMMCAICFGMSLIGCAHKREMMDREFAAGKQQGNAIREYLDRDGGNGPGTTPADTHQMLADFNRHQPRLGGADREPEGR